MEYIITPTYKPILSLLRFDYFPKKLWQAYRSPLICWRVTNPSTNPQTIPSPVSFPTRAQFGSLRLGKRRYFSHHFFYNTLFYIIVIYIILIICILQQLFYNTISCKDNKNYFGRINKKHTVPPALDEKDGRWASWETCPC